MDGASPQEPLERARRIGGGLVWSQVGRIFDIGLGLLFSVLVVRVLGPGDYAVYAVAWSIVNVAALLASLGYGEVLTRFLPEYQVQDRARSTALVRRLFVERLLVSLIVGVGVWAGVAPLAVWTRTPVLPQVIGLVAALAVAQGVWDILVGYYTATLRMRDHALIRVIAQVTSLGLALLLFVTAGVHVWVPLVAQLASFLISVLLYLVGARHALRLPSQSVSLSQARRYGGYVWLTNLATFGLASQIDVLLIAALLTDKAQVSYYNVAAVVLGKLYVLLTGWNAVVIPSAAEARATLGTAGLARSFDLYMKLNLAVLVPPLFFVLGWGEPLISAVFGKPFLPAAAPLQVFALFGLLSALAGANVCQPLLYVADRQRALMWLRVAAGALNIILDVVLIPPLGAIGAVVGTGISNLVVHIAELWLLRKVVNAYPVGVAAKLLLAGGLAFLPSLLMPDLEWVSLVGGAALFALVFFVVIRPLHPLSSADSATLDAVIPRLRPILRWLAASG
ncbi:MAG: flippase [Rudaea sp.]